MKHNPLGYSDNALLSLVQGRELCLHNVVGIRHVCFGTVMQMFANLIDLIVEPLEFKVLKLRESRL